jgi:hypothetical protein
LPFRSDDGIVVVEVGQKDDMDTDMVPRSLREELGPEATSGLLELFARQRSLWKDDVMTAVVDRFERRLVEETSKLRLEISDVRHEMRQGFADVRQEFANVQQEFANVRQEFANVRQEIGHLRLGLADDRFALLKWAFIFWVGQFFAVVSVMLVLIRFLKPGS